MTKKHKTWMDVLDVLVEATVMVVSHGWTKMRLRMTAPVDLFVKLPLLLNTHSISATQAGLQIDFLL